jgi:hypothetical protein
VAIASLVDHGLIILGRGVSPRTDAQMAHRPNARNLTRSRNFQVAEASQVGPYEPSLQNVTEHTTNFDVL